MGRSDQYSELKEEENVCNFNERRLNFMEYSESDRGLGQSHPESLCYVLDFTVYHCTAKK